MALQDSKKVVFALKYNGAVAGTDAIPISSEDVRLSPVVASGSYKCLNGKIGSKTVWVNSENTVVEGATVDGLLTGNDATGTALATLPSWDAIYQACGLTATVVASTSVTYTPSQNQPSGATTCAIWRDGNKRTLSNVLGSLTLSGVVGEPMKQTASLYGFTSSISTADANPTAVCTNEALLLVLKSIDTVTVGGTACKAQSFTLDQGNDIQKQYFIGVKGYERVDFDASLELVFLKENDNAYTDFIAGTSQAVVITAGQTNGKKVKITVGQAVISENPTESSINGKEAITVKYHCKGDATGINQFAIKFGNVA